MNILVCILCFAVGHFIGVAFTEWLHIIGWDGHDCVRCRRDVGHECDEHTRR